MGNPCAEKQQVELRNQVPIHTCRKVGRVPNAKAFHHIFTAQHAVKVLAVNDENIVDVEDLLDSECRVISVGGKLV
eukprot:IDg22705t1